MPCPARRLFSAYLDFYRPYIARTNRLLSPYGIYTMQRAVMKRLAAGVPDAERELCAAVFARMEDRPATGE